MNYKIAMIPLLLSGLFGACNDNEELIKTNPDFVEAGYGALTLTLKYPTAPGTKAVGDTLVGLAYDQEKTIKSVAFFVKTDPETVSSELMYGSFGSYFSDEPLLTANGLQEELEEVAAGTPGEYTAKILHRSDGWKDPQVIVIANYKENGLSDKLKAVTDWETLQSVVSTTLAANPQTPLLMYATKTIEAWKRAVGNNGGGLASADFDMERLVSRIDIRNNAYNKADESKGFVLTSARLVRPKTASYLLPNTGLITQPVSAEPFATSGTVTEGTIGGLITIQQLDSLYAYENDNADPATATAVQIDGTYRGGKISKVIEMKKADGVGIVGDPIALARNRRYVININAAPDSSDIKWDIVVKDWGEGDTIKVKADYQKPDLAKAFQTAVFNAGSSGLTWNKTSKVFDITKATGNDATLEFTVSGTTAAEAEVVYGFDTDGSSVDKTTDIVTVGTPVVTYGAATVETPIKITIPQQKADEKVPLDIYVRIRNVVNPSVYDSITIKSRPVYNGVTNANPVLMKDGKYWAPINVGATLTTNVAIRTENTDMTNTCGKLFQWGRYDGVNTTNISSVINNDKNTNNPVQADLDNMSAWKGKVILPTATSQKNWLLINGAGNPNPDPADMETGAWYQRLWNANEGIENTDVSKTTADPCPTGWRVPTIRDWEAIGAGLDNAVNGVSWNSTNNAITIPGKESGKNLVLPAAGRRQEDGSLYNYGVNCYYWASSAPDRAIQANSIMYLSGTVTYSGKLQSRSDMRAFSFSVRCIQE